MQNIQDKKVKKTNKRKKIKTTKIANKWVYKNAASIVYAKSSTGQLMILLIVESKGTITTPGGRRETQDKNSSHTAFREMYEETLHDGVSLIDFSRMYEFKQHKMYHINTVLHMYYYTQIADECYIPLSNNETIGMLWLPVEEITMERLLDKDTLYTVSGGRKYKMRDICIHTFRTISFLRNIVDNLPMYIY